MKLADALASKQRFTRPELSYGLRFDGIDAEDDYGNKGRYFDAREVLAEDWEIDEKPETKLELTRTELVKILLGANGKDITQYVHNVFIDRSK